MNERIKELAGRACDIMPLYDSINRGDYTHSQYNMQIELLLEKFAELIVRECADVIAPMGDLCGGHGEPRMPSTRECAQRLKEYFGVE